MSELLQGLVLVRRALVRRHVALVVLGAAAALAAVWGAAAFLAWAGAFRLVRWGPAVCWLAALAGLGFAVRATVRAARGAGLPSLRDAAALVEGELALRRGSLQILDVRKLVRIAGYDENYLHRRMRLSAP